VFNNSVDKMDDLQKMDRLTLRKIQRENERHFFKMITSGEINIRWLRKWDSR
jgi:hypothetical protein